MIQPLTATATASASSSASAALKVIDGNEQSAWLSEGTLPSLFIGRSDLNILFGLGNTGACSMLATGNCNAMTDGDLNTSVGVYIYQIANELGQLGNGKLMSR